MSELAPLQQILHNVMTCERGRRKYHLLPLTVYCFVSMSTKIFLFCTICTRIYYMYVRLKCVHLASFSSLWFAVSYTYVLYILKYCYMTIIWKYYHQYQEVNQHNFMYKIITVMGLCINLKHNIFITNYLHIYLQLCTTQSMKIQAQCFKEYQCCKAD